jgi:hypothetical protein
MAKGRHEKALQTSAKAHAQGNEEDEVVQIEFGNSRDYQTGTRI